MTDMECLEAAREHMLALLRRVPVEATATQLDAACRVAAAVCELNRELRISRTFEQADQEQVH